MEIQLHAHYHVVSHSLGKEIQQKLIEIKQIIEENSIPRVTKQYATVCQEHF